MSQINLLLMPRVSTPFWIQNNSEGLSGSFFIVPFQVEERKQSYLDTYDVVLVKDETMEVPNAIMLYLTGNKWRKKKYG